MVQIALNESAIDPLEHLGGPRMNGNGLGGCRWPFETIYGPKINAVA
jgi:hypothetical protein